MMNTTDKSVSHHGPFEIYLVGLGIVGIRHMTLEGQDCIRASKRVYYVDHGFGVPEYLQTICPKTTNLLYEYQEGESRLRTYRGMAAEVINGALDDPPVCFATYGHPTMYVYPSVLIKKAAALLDLRVHVVPGISTLDTVWVDLGIDPGLTGMQIYEATGLLIQNRELQPDVPCLLLQVDTVESGLFSRAASKAERFRRLQEHLLKFYPQEHRVITVFSATHPLLVPIRDEFPLSELPQRYARSTQSGTLYIPPLGGNIKRNELLEKQLYDRKHLERITVRTSER